MPSVHLFPEIQQRSVSLSSQDQSSRKLNKNVKGVTRGLHVIIRKKSNQMMAKSHQLKQFTPSRKLNNFKIKKRSSCSYSILICFQWLMQFTMVPCSSDKKTCKTCISKIIWGKSKKPGYQMNGAFEKQNRII